VETEWFQSWFGEDYKALYPHRDDSQAGVQADALIRAAGFDSSWNILDVGCGAGRHLRAFRTRGLRATGIDLSPVLLRDARAEGLNVARADMRRLPFPDATFDLAACLFTSFGYFATPAEDVSALREFCRVVRPLGLLFLDLPNPVPLSRDLVAGEVMETAGRRVEIARSIEGDLVVKRMRITGKGRAALPDDLVYEERVRLWSAASLGPVLGQLGLETAAVLGDERGSAFDPGTSPRMSLLLRRAA
jgi:SAM-dependent methyltransferase